MQNSVLRQVSQEDCNLTLSFGETLDDLLAESAISQKILVFKLRAVGLNWTDNKVSRLINNELPNNLKAQEVRKIGEALNCDTERLARLFVAYTCHKLTEWGVFQKIR